MNHSFEQLEHSLVKIRMEVEESAFEAAITRAYNKNKKQIALPGFRKGKAPLKLIEQAYGKQVFYEDAINEILPVAYEEALRELKLEVLSRPEIDVDEIKAGEPVVLYATVATRPEVKLCDYKKLTVEKKEVSVTEEEIEKEIKKQAEQNGRQIEIEGEAQEGDVANIDFEGFTDGVAFEGGKGENHDLKLGSHSFIDTFEDQLIGKKAGDDVDVNVTFPEQYGAKELAGKPALFKVHVNKVTRTELPEINDEFAQDVSEFDTLADYKKDVEVKITEKKAAENKRERSKAIMDKLIEGTEIDICDLIVDSRIDQMLRDMEQQMKYQGISLEQYMQYTGTTMEQLRKNMQGEALRSVQEELILDAVAKAEALSLSDEDLDKEFSKLAEMYKMDVETVKKYMGAEMDSFKESLLKEKAVDFLAENVKA